MGLLDSIIPPNGQGGGLLADPLFRIGMSLLARGGPAKQPHSFGQDLSGAVSDLHDSQEADTTDEMKRLQLQDYKESLKRKAANREQMDRMMRSWMPELGGDPGGGPGGQPQPQAPALSPGMTAGPIAGSPLGQGFANAAPTPMIPGQPPMPPQPQETGLSPGYASRVGKFESKDNYDSRSEVSSARGRYQFTDGTYKDYAPMAQVDPNDWSPQAQDRVFERFTKSNTGRLQMAGLPVNDVNAYTMHLLGPAAGQIFANAADSARVDQIGVSEEARNNNPAIFKGATTVGEARRNIQDKVFGPDAPAPETAPPSTQATAPTSPVDTMNALSGIPTATRKALMVGAYMASGGDSEKFMENLGQSVLQFNQQQAARDAKKPTYGQPIKLSDGRWVRPVDDGTFKDVTEELGKDTSRQGVGGVVPMLDINKPEDQPTIEQIATYHRKPVPAGTRNGQAQRQNQLDTANEWRAAHGLTPYTEGMYDSINQTRNAYNKGVEGRATTAANSAANHLTQMMGLIDSLNNGELRGFNAFANAWKDQFGGEAPSDWHIVARFVGDEITKAIIPGAASMQERAANEIKASGSPEILRGNIQQYIGLLGGQLLSREENYNTGMQDLAHDVPYTSYLAPNTKQILEEARGRAQPTVMGGGDDKDALPLPANKKDLVKGKKYKFPDGHVEPY